MDDTNLQLHQLLFIESACQLGRVHLILMKAGNELYSKCHPHDQASNLDQNQSITLQMDNFPELFYEVDLDEVNWWIFKRETAIDDLEKRTNLVLKSVQILKKSSKEIERKIPRSYHDLILVLKNFADKHSQQIHEL